MRNVLGLTKIGRVTIGDNVFIGAGSIILQNVCIGKNSIIGAGSVVTKDIPADSIAAGNPAKVIDSLKSFIEKHKTLAKVRKDENPVNGIGYLS
jgi:maltose O-acetyltransferase